MPLAMRFCPLCDEPTAELSCPEHAVPTLTELGPRPNRGRIKSGARLGERYTIGKELGSGSVGTVFSAHRAEGSGDEQVAIKVLRHGIKPGKQIRRFFQEARAASLLDHPNIVRVFDFGVDAQTHAPFLAMEFVDGDSLRNLIDREGTLLPDRALRIARAIADALAHAHQKGVVHRDLKPDNVMLIGREDVERVKVVDFGMATILGGDGDQIERITRTGTTVGTPLYMSPEQIRSSRVDARADLYSLGCILFEMLSGRPPFTGTRVVDVMDQHLRAPVPALPLRTDGSTFPSALGALVNALLEKEREQRTPSAEALIDALRGLDLGTNTLRGRRAPPTPDRPSIADTLVVPIRGTPRAIPLRSEAHFRSDDASDTIPLHMMPTTGDLPTGPNYRIDAPDVLNAVDSDSITRATVSAPPPPRRTVALAETTAKTSRARWLISLAVLAVFAVYTYTRSGQSNAKTITYKNLSPKNVDPAPPPSTEPPSRVAEPEREDELVRAAQPAVDRLEPKAVRTKPRPKKRARDIPVW